MASDDRARSQITPSITSRPTSTSVAVITASCRGGSNGTTRATMNRITPTSRPGSRLRGSQSAVCWIR
ncbi:MAG: hypothetical protein CL610_27560 [Anaerolineaceae bacterium]|nr:hypothetical protein [Anaerolineaceae bacterium]